MLVRALRGQGAWGRGKGAELKLHLPGGNLATPPTSTANSAHLLLPGTCPVVQAQNWIQGMDTSEVPRKKNTDEAQQLAHKCPEQAGPGPQQPNPAS